MIQVAQKQARISNRKIRKDSALKIQKLFVGSDNVTVNSNWNVTGGTKVLNST